MSVSYPPVPMALELFECTRLSARISRPACKANRARGVFACAECKGLGVAVNFDTGVVDMSSKCKHVGCEKTSQKGKNGLCVAHFKEFMSPIESPVKVNAKKSMLLSECLSEQFSEIKAVNSVFVPFGTDAVIIQALLEAWFEKEAEWLVDLSGLKPGMSICYAAKMIKSLQALGY